MCLPKPTSTYTQSGFKPEVPFEFKAGDKIVNPSGVLFRILPTGAAYYETNGDLSAKYCHISRDVDESIFVITHKALSAKFTRYAPPVERFTTAREILESGACESGVEFLGHYLLGKKVFGAYRVVELLTKADLLDCKLGLQRLYDWSIVNDVDIPNGYLSFMAKLLGLIPGQSLAVLTRTSLLNILGIRP